MKTTGRCPKCGGLEIVSDAKAVDRGESNSQHDLSVAVDQKPEAIFFKGRQMTAVSAWVCLSCGFVEFYADSPAALRLPAK